MKIAVLIGVATTFGCSSEGGPPNPEALVDIQQGVYGLTTQQDDVGDNPVLAHANFRVLVFDHVPVRDTSLTGTAFTKEAPLTQTVSDGGGFYQLALEPKRYVFCSSFGRCVWLEIRKSERTRLDYQSSVGPGWSKGDMVRW